MNDKGTKNLRDQWRAAKRSWGLAEICHKMHLNPLYVFVSVNILIALGSISILYYLYVPIISIIFALFVVLSIFNLGFFIFFHRDPEREITKKNGAILSPADGEIVYIKKIDAGEVPISIKGKNSIKLDELTKYSSFTEIDGYLIGIGMKLFDVHTNRSPISGFVKLSRHNPGKFINQTLNEFEITNESHTTVLKHEEGYYIGIVQIATFLVRGIESYLSDGDFIEQGERMGRIKIGSQVDLLIPFRDVEIKVKLHDRVYAGESILAELKK
jgi:phosphatidylserine decarboxylase